MTSNPAFEPPLWQVEGIKRLVPLLHSIATVERHDERWRQLRWKPGADDAPFIETNMVLVNHGYAPPAHLVQYLKAAGVARMLVGGIQANTCCVAAGFMQFDARLAPTLLKGLTVGSSLDRSGELGARLWHHHFGVNSAIDGSDADLAAARRV